MNNSLKNQIASEVRVLSARTSQNKVAKQADVSNGTISQMVNNNWALISDDMWRKIQINLNITLGWQIAETSNFNAITELLTAAQSQSLAIGISHDAGAGKSSAYRNYARTHNNVIYVEAKNYWSKKSYVSNLLQAAGIRGGGTTEEMIERLINEAKGNEKSLLIIDQFDKLKEPSMDLFMDIYNDIHPSCGFLLSGVPALEKKIKRGRNRDKIGYDELWSRIGRKFIKLDPIKLSDVTSVCNANGLFDPERIKMIFQTCEGDLRRVRREVEKYHLLN